MADRLNEARWAGAKSTYPGKVEWGCLTQTFRKGPLDRVFIHDDETGARMDVLQMREKGVEALLVSRVVPGWTETPTSLAELKEQRARLQAEEGHDAHPQQWNNDADAANEADGISNG